MSITETDWLRLWRELVEESRRLAGQRRSGRTGSQRKAPQYFDAATKRKSVRPDPLVDFTVGKLTPESSVLDIGAGTGRWTIPMARVAKRVTALDASPQMLDILRENAAEEGCTNIDTVQARWDEIEVEPHDVVVSSHSMYGAADLAAFVRKMEGSATGLCFLAMRVPSHDGVMAELSRHVHGHGHDSPNFIIGYNAILSMGIYANVMMEPIVSHWTNDSLEDAFGRAKRHLMLAADDSSHDDFIRQVLARRLVLRDGVYHWPDGMRSGLAWWEVADGR